MRLSAQVGKTECRGDQAQDQSQAGEEGKTSAVNLKFLSLLPQVGEGTSNSKTALVEWI